MLTAIGKFVSIDTLFIVKLLYGGQIKKINVFINIWLVLLKSQGPMILAGRIKFELKLPESHTSYESQNYTLLMAGSNYKKWKNQLVK